MIQFKRIFCFGFMVSILGLLTGAPLAAAEPQAEKANWENLKQLVPAQEIKVVLNDAKAFQGKFQSVSDEAIVVKVGTDDQTLARQDVLRVSARRQGHRLRNAGGGAAAGAGGGAILAAASCRDDPECSAIAWAVAPLTGALVGAAVGAVLPTGGWREVYRAR